MKNILITGASGGIGRALASAFAEPDNTLFLHYRTETLLFSDFVKQLRESGATVIPWQADFNKQEQIEQMLAAALRQLNSIDLLINNAGLSYNGLLQEMSMEEWLTLFQVNVNAVFTTSKAVLPGMIQRKRGNIINISSIWGSCGASCEVAYSASKAAVLGFSKALAAEVGASGIRVNCVTPGVIDTAMNSCYSKDDMELFLEEVPLRRIGKPEEVAALVRFLASDEASYITGQTIRTDGGFLR